MDSPGEPEDAFLTYDFYATFLTSTSSAKQTPEQVQEINDMFMTLTRDVYSSGINESDIDSNNLVDFKQPHKQIAKFLSWNLHTEFLENNPS